MAPPVGHTPEQALSTISMFSFNLCFYQEIVPLKVPLLQGSAGQNGLRATCSVVGYANGLGPARSAGLIPGVATIRS